jgi:hypothetical protein
MKRNGYMASRGVKERKRERKRKKEYKEETENGLYL